LVPVIFSGGAAEIANSMYHYLKEKHPDAFTFRARATAMRVASDAKGEGVFVQINYGEELRFTHVISTIPLPVLRTMDLTQAGMLPMQKSALRQLTYMPATKIGMQFKTAWWTHAKDKNGRVLGIIGGQSYTDSPLRTIVYPSFGDVAKGQATTLISSFTWTDDADRFSALVAHDQETLTKLVVRELARIHNIDEGYLRDQLIGVYPWAWSLDIHTMGLSRSVNLKMTLC
jgi:monoamine oxidase